MTREEAVETIKVLMLKIEPPTDTQLGWLETWVHKEDIQSLRMAIKALEQELKVGYCKDCKWWKDSDGFYRRGGHAESQCPINRREVFEGNGYCYMFEPRESEDEDE